MEGTIAEGDLVYVYVVADERRRGYVFRAQRSAVYSTFAGAIRGSDLVGAPWGTRLSLGRAAAYLLPLTRYEMQMYVLKRRGQVIYPKDQGYIVAVSGVAPGMRVLEAGVGSGFLTSLLASIVGCEGRVIGYDVRSDMLEAARRNLEALGLADCVEFRLGDVRRGVPERDLDAVFLDMPDPWAALEALHASVKPGAPATVFVPTYNQLEKLATIIDGRGWVLVEAVELLRREIEVRPGAVRPSTQMIGHTGFIALLRKVETPEGNRD